MSKKPFRVLFVGNSFIFVHDLPGLLVHVSKSLGRDVQVANSTIGGCTLYAQTAASSARTAALLHERWDAIVLQEYSALPLVAKARDKYLRPAIRAFRARARARASCCCCTSRTTRARCTPTAARARRRTCRAASRADRSRR